jgi:hypothetical protein
MSFIHPEQLRSRMELFLEERLESEVDLEAFGAHPLPTTSVDGSGLVLRRRKDAERIPFMEIDTFEVRAAPLGLFRTPRRIQYVKLTGVNVHVAPSRGPEKGDDQRSMPAMRPIRHGGAGRRSSKSSSRSARGLRSSRGTRRSRPASSRFTASG